MSRHNGSSSSYQKNYLKQVKLNNITAPNITNLYRLFYYDSLLESVEAIGLDTSKVTNMSYAFYYCSALKSDTLTISDWVTDSVKNMSYMFYNCSNLIDLDFSK